MVWTNIHARQMVLGAISPEVRQPLTRPLFKASSSSSVARSCSSVKSNGTLQVLYRRLNAGGLPVKVASILSIVNTAQNIRLRISATMNGGERLDVGEYIGSVSRWKPSAVTALASRPCSLHSPWPTLLYQPIRRSGDQFGMAH